MKKTTITIILLVLIGLCFILFENLSKKGPVTVDVKGYIDVTLPLQAEVAMNSSHIMNDGNITDSKIRIFAANAVDNKVTNINKMRNLYALYLGSAYHLDESKYVKVMPDMSKLSGDGLAKVYVKAMLDVDQKIIKESNDYIKQVDKFKKGSSTTKSGITISNGHPAIDDSYDLAKNILDTSSKEVDVLNGLMK
jgi:hypothetical protein